jgi:hypothetical protein
MPTTLNTTVRHISDSVSNKANSGMLSELHSYMQNNNASERHQNNTLKVMIAYAKFLGPPTVLKHQSIKNINQICF